MESIPWVFIALVVAGILVLGIGILALYMANKKKNAFAETGKHPKGHYLGVGMAMGMPLGFAISLPIGIAMDNIALGVSMGPALGAGFGLAYGASLEKKHEHELRPLTEGELKFRRYAVLFLAGILFLAMLVIALIFYLNA